jgi:hypothetical protein
MSDSIRAIGTAIQKMTGTFKNDPVTLIWGKVKSVDESAATCNIIIENDVEVPNVALQAAVCDGLLLIPAVDSDVIALKSVNGPSAIVILTSDLDKVILQVGDASLTIWNSAQNGNQIMQLNDGGFGGLLKLLDPNNQDAGVLARLNKIEKKVNDIITTYDSHTHPVAGAVANATTNTIAAPLIETQRTDIENKLIIHGE